ncbi:GHKL domain-containing protein [Pelagibacterales bacterium SAG-MED05]|nr:GHKL domain-containing protein [Pelagibacterales bacterium SAG-MED05]
MTLLFLSLAVIIAIVVILVSAKHIKKGFDARSEVRNQKQSENLDQEVQDITNEDIEDDPQKGAILNQLDDYLIILDKYKNIKYLNPSAKNKFGKESLGKHIATILRVPDLLQNIDLVLNKRKTINMDLELNQPSFQFFKVYIMIGESVFSDDPDTLNLFLKDLTEIVKAQKFKSDFVANVSHELKTPLVSIKGFLETISGHAKDDLEAQKKFIPIMLEQADRMESLIKDLLSLSKIELEEHIQPQDKVNLKEVLSNVEDIHQKNLKLFEFKNNIKDDFFIKGDHEKLIEVFSNIIDNSIKYSEKNKKIEVNCGQGNGKVIGDSYTVSIKDKGIGIPTEQLPRITERFFRVDAAKSKKVGGTGLGMAIVKHIVNQHRGELEIKSEAQSGTEIKVHFSKF